MTDSNAWVSVSTEYVTPRLPGERDVWEQEAAGRGSVGRQMLREVAEVRPPADVAKALKLHDNQLAVVRRRLMLLDERPVELTDSYYPLFIARGTPLAEPRKIAGGATTLLAQLGYHSRRVREDVSAHMPNAYERELLGLGDPDPVLVLFRLVTGDGGLPIEVSVMTMVADGHHLRYEISV